VARDFGNKMEISDGIKAGETVVLDVPDGLANGTKVKVEMAPVPKEVPVAPAPAANFIPHKDPARVLLHLVRPPLSKDLRQS
jgi:hypothetical protein